MINTSLPSSRKFPGASQIPSEFRMEASQKRTRAMMNKAAELARVALDLEKDLQWEEALRAYTDVCIYFKRILEIAESKDVSDVLFVYHKYSKRLAFIRSKIISQNPELIATSKYPTREASPVKSSGGSPLPVSSLLKNKTSAPKYGRLRSDSFTNPSNSNPLAFARRPSLAPANPSICQSLKKAPTLKKSSVERFSRGDLKTDFDDSLETSRFSRRVGSSPSEAFAPHSDNRKSIYYSQTDLLSSKHKEIIPPASLKEKQELRRLLDLNSIPENEENIQSLTQDDGTSAEQFVARPVSRARPRLSHNPSMPNIYSSVPTMDSDTKAQGSDNDRIQSTFGNSYSPNWRDSRYISSSRGFDDISSFYSSPSNSSPLLLSSTASSSAQGSDSSKALDVSPQSDDSESSPLSRECFLSEGRPHSARPSSMSRNRIIPEGLQLSIQTDDAFRSNLDQASPSSVISPVSNSKAAKACKIVFRILWQEEIKSKPAWIPPPSMTALRPLWQLACIKETLTVGGFIGNKRIFIQPSLWRQPGVRFAGLEVKIQVLEYMHDYLCRLREHWFEDVLGVRQGLDDLDALALNTHQALASKLSYIPALKRSQNSAAAALASFANKISKSVERFQANYSKDKVEGNAAYFDLLVKFIDSCGFLEGWYIRFTNKAITDPAYTPLLARIQRFFEFLKCVVLTFIHNDLDACLAKFLKRTRELAIE